MTVAGRRGNGANERRRPSLSCLLLPQTVCGLTTYIVTARCSAEVNGAYQEKFPEMAQSRGENPLPPPRPGTARTDQSVRIRRQRLGGLPSQRVRSLSAVGNDRLLDRLPALPPGWRPLVERLAEAIDPDVEVVDVRSKRGSLAIFLGEGVEVGSTTWRIAREAEHASTHTCEICGSSEAVLCRRVGGEITPVDPWLKTLCEAHRIVEAPDRAAGVYAPV